MSFELASEIKEALISSFDAPYFSAGRKVNHAQLYRGDIPLRADVLRPEDFPFIAIVPFDGEDVAGKSSTESVMIRTGIQVTDVPEAIEIGYHDVSNLVSRARRVLLEAGILAGKYTLKTIKWQIGDKDGQQPHPVYLGGLLTTWETPTVQRKRTEAELIIYGDK